MERLRRQRVDRTGLSRVTEGGGSRKALSREQEEGGGVKGSGGKTTPESGQVWTSQSQRAVEDRQRWRQPTGCEILDPWCPYDPPGQRIGRQTDRYIDLFSNSFGA